MFARIHSTAFHVSGSHLLQDSSRCFLTLFSAVSLVSSKTGEHTAVAGTAGERVLVVVPALLLDDRAELALVHVILGAVGLNAFREIGPLIRFGALR
jgi:hypothetical protein